MRIFYDCEFVERGRELPIQLVSIGMVDEDGRRLYRINEECLSAVTRHPWLNKFVVPFLPIATPVQGIFEWDTKHEEYEFVSALDRLAADVLEFIRAVPNPELWAYYGAYDHVVLCQLFGSMAELPAGVPMFTHDLQQHWEMFGYGRPLPAEPWNAHHAMYDAEWCRDAYNSVAHRVPGPVTGEVVANSDGEVIEGVIEP